MNVVLRARETVKWVRALAVQARVCVPKTHIKTRPLHVSITLTLRVLGCHWLISLAEKVRASERPVLKYQVENDTRGHRKPPLASSWAHAHEHRHVQHTHTHTQEKRKKYFSSANVFLVEAEFIVKLCYKWLPDALGIWRECSA